MKRLLKINLLVIVCVALLVAVFATAAAASTLDGPTHPGRPGRPSQVATGGNIHIGTRANITSRAKEHVSYIVGYKDGTIRPNAPTTRAEAATMFYRLMDGPTRHKNWSDENKFSDVPFSAWYNSAVSTVTKARIIKGYPGGTFNPDAPVTRAEFVAMLIRFHSVSLVSGKAQTFKDVDKDNWANPYIETAYEKGWIKGSAKNFRPDDLITRAEAVTMVNRAAERAPHDNYMLPDMKKWTDNDPGTWYYADMQEASNSHLYCRTDQKVPNTNILYEKWLHLRPNPKWSVLEKSWVAAYSGR